MKINIQDVKHSGSVRQAILDYCTGSDSVSSGEVGPTFSCSGPGSGWQRNYNVTDYAAAALSDDYGAVSYIDCDDGREATLDEDGDVVWSDDSVVKLLVPSEDDAVRYPDALAEMACAVIWTHGSSSDRSGWKNLLLGIREAASKIEDLDLSELD